MMRRIFLPRVSVFGGDLILVNASFRYRGQGEGTLVSVTENNLFLSLKCRRALTDTLSAVGAEAKILPVSGWRSESEQTRLFQNSLFENGRAFTEKFVAFPGCSEHQTGLAVDLALKPARGEKIDEICPDFPYAGVCMDFRRRAADFGLIERYPAGKETVTGIGHEPWHFRYVGVPHAQEITRLGLTLEEYLSFLRNYTAKNPYCVSFGGRIASVWFLPVAESTVLCPESGKVSLSGNNSDGFIVTEWKGGNEL